MPINLSGIPESPGKAVLTSANAAYETTDIKEDNPDNHRGGGTDESEQEPEYVNVINKGSDTVDEGQAPDKASGQPENNSEHKNNENNAVETNTSADSGSKVEPPVAIALDVDEEHILY